MKQEPMRFPEPPRSRKHIEDDPCTEIRELLSSTLDGETTIAERERAFEHVGQCDECAGMLRMDRAVHRAVARRRRSGPQPQRSPLDVVRWVHREDRRRTRAVGFRRLAVAASLLVLAWLGTSLLLHDQEQELPCEDILVHLDVLEDLEEQGIEPTAELLEILLETASHESGSAIDPAWVDLEIFEVLLEEEILPENL